MIHYFDTEVAKRFGINCAVILNSLELWLEKNRANEEYIFENRVWVRNSKRAMTELFPYLNERQINYAVQKLIDENIILKNNFNEKTNDRTLWLTISDTGFSILQNCKMHLTKLSNDNNNIYNNIYNNSNIIKNTKNINIINTNKNINNNINNNILEKEIQKKKEIPKILLDLLPNEELQNLFCEFLKVRKIMKKPMTDLAIKNSINKLNKLASTDEEKKKIINQSIDHNWLTFYPLKNDNDYYNYNVSSSNKEFSSKVKVMGDKKLNNFNQEDVKLDF